MRRSSSTVRIVLTIESAPVQLQVVKLFIAPAGIRVAGPGRESIGTLGVGFYLRLRPAGNACHKGNGECPTIANGW